MRARNRCATRLLVAALLVIVSLVASGEAQRNTTTRNSQQGPSWDEQKQNERLLAGLNESLSRFLQTSGSGADEPPAALTMDNDDNNQQQQQIIALKKISCSKISLVVMAQRALNASANLAALRKLAECRRENLLDLELVEALERSTTTTRTGAESGSTTPMQQTRAQATEADDHRLCGDRRRPESDTSSNQTSRQRASGQAKHQARDRPFVRQQQPQELQASECAPEHAPGQASASSSDRSQVAAAQELPATGLHLGAKLALALVALVVALVCVATYLDGRQTRVDTKLDASRPAMTTNHHHERSRLENTHHKAGRENNAGRFFLDLGPQAAKLRDYRSLSISSNSSSNLFCSSQSVASSSAPILPVSQQQHQQQRAATATPASGQHLHSCSLYESNLQLHVSQSNPTGSELASANHSPARRARGLAWQMVLAFSLRRTAGQIFERQQQRPQAATEETDQVDWLHGLRFFSMIWVIVIHSYNFALRWMFFSNTSTLDGVYKSTASQFIANGSFACDSFFFVGGFLLPYLALRPAKRLMTASSTAKPLTERDLLKECEQEQDHDQEQEQEQEHEHEHEVVMVGENEQRARQQVATSDDSAANLCPCCCSCCAPCCCSWCTSAASLTGGGSCRRHRARQQTARLSPTGSCAQCSGGGAAEQAATCSAASCIGFRGAPSTPPPSSNSNPTSTHSTRRQLVGNINERTSAQHHVHIPPVCQLRGSPPPPQTQHTQPPAPATEDLSQCSRGRQVDSGPQEACRSSTPNSNQFTWQRCLANVIRRYVRMTPLMMAIIGLCANLLRYLGAGPVWQESTMMYDDWCRRNWWVNALFLHNFVNRENMCLSHSWYSAVDFQLFLCGQLILFALARSKRLGLLLLVGLLLGSPLITMLLTLRHHLPAVPLISSVNEQTMNLYYGEIYIKPYSRASPYLIGILLAYLMRTTRLAQCRLRGWQLATGWTLAVALLLAIILAMQPAMNGHSPSELSSALYSGWSRPLWACATGWIIFACITKQAGLVGRILGARCLVPLSKLTYPAFLIHPIIMASFYGTRQASFQFSHYLMLYLILGNIVITYASAFMLATLVELPFLSIERVISRRLFK